MILDPEGREVARSLSSPTVPAGTTAAALVRITVVGPRLWDVERPHLYKVISTVKRGDAVLDRYETPFGIRSIEWGPGKGFLLNGRRVPLRGVCNHHDLGALGAAVNRRAIERQLEILKRMGTNAIRTSHNPPAPELLDAADRMGFLVLDEAFDMWGKTKIQNGHGKYFAEWGERDLRDMIRRDRNHPSVVMWSIGNEILEQADADGWKVAKRLTDICHEEDPTRPVTAGFNQVGERHQEPPGRAGGHPRLQLRRPPVREDPGRAPRVDDRGRGDGLLRQLARGLPPADREVREAPVAPAHELRRGRAALGVLPGRRVRRARGLAGRCSASSCGRGSTTWASRPRTSRGTSPGTRRTGPRAAPTSGSWTSPGSRRTASTSTRASGRRSRWCTCCPTGTGPGSRGNPSR